MNQYGLSMNLASLGINENMYKMVKISGKRIKNQQLTQQPIAIPSETVIEYEAVQKKLFDNLTVTENKTIKEKLAECETIDEKIK